MIDNKDMPANPCTYKQQTKTGMGYGEKTVHEKGETKREKAFWQIYSAMVACPESVIGRLSYDEIAINAIEATNAGFKALSDGASVDD